MIAKGFSAALAVVFLMDLAWVGWLASGFYKARLGHLMADKVYWPAAIAFYLLYPAGIWFFAARQAASAGEAALRGAALGLLVYGVYNFTNMALLKDWSGRVVAIDTCWGMFLTAAAAWISFLAASR